MALNTENSFNNFDFSKLASLIVSEKEKHISRIDNFHIPSILTLEKYMDTNRGKWMEPGKKQKKFAQALQSDDNDENTQCEQFAKLFSATKPPKKKAPKRSSIKHYHIMKRMSMCIVPYSKLHAKSPTNIGKDEVDSFDLTQWASYQKHKKAATIKQVTNTNTTKKWQPNTMTKNPMHSGALKASATATSSTGTFKQPMVKNSTATASSRIATKNPSRFGRQTEKLTLDIAKANQRSNPAPSLRQRQLSDPRALVKNAVKKDTIDRRSSKMTLHRSTEALVKSKEKTTVDSSIEEPQDSCSKVSVTDSSTLIHRLSEFLNSPFETRIAGKPNTNMSTSQVTLINPSEPADIYQAYRKFNKKTKLIAEELRLNEKITELHNFKQRELKSLTLDVKQLVPQIRTDGEAFDEVEVRRLNALLEDIRTMIYLLDTKASIYCIPKVKHEAKLRNLMKVVDGLLLEFLRKNS